MNAIPLILAEPLPVAPRRTSAADKHEADKLAKRFLTVVHTMADPAHEPRGAY